MVVERNGGVIVASIDYSGTISGRLLQISKKWSTLDCAVSLRARTVPCKVQPASLTAPKNERSSNFERRGE
jgi:hypothetical protein